MELSKWAFRRGLHVSMHEFLMKTLNCSHSDQLQHQFLVATTVFKATLYYRQLLMRFCMPRLVKYEERQAVSSTVTNVILNL